MQFETIQSSYRVGGLKLHPIGSDKTQAPDNGFWWFWCQNAGKLLKICDFEPTIAYMPGELTGFFTPSALTESIVKLTEAYFFVWK